MTIEEKAEVYSEIYFNKDESSMRISKISFIDGYELASKEKRYEEDIKEAYKKGYANGQMDAFM